MSALNEYLLRLKQQKSKQYRIAAVIIVLSLLVSLVVVWQLRLTGITWAEGDPEVGETLGGDYAYLTDVAMVSDSLRTGTAPWDVDDDAGNDSGDKNTILRTYDTASYTVTFTSKVREQESPYRFYKEGMLYFEFALPGNSKQIQYEYSSMNWLVSKNATYVVTEETVNGRVCQVLRGKFLWQTGSDDKQAIGESTQTLNVEFRALAMHNGDKVKPKMTFWLEGNQVGVDYTKWGTSEYTGGVVTGTTVTCTNHSETEHKTVQDATEITISAAARYNVQVKNNSAAKTTKVGYYDFNTGNEKALDKTVGSEIYGRLTGYGIVVQIVGKTGHGLKGVELPRQGSDITFNLALDAKYKVVNQDKTTTVTDLNETNYRPLIWSFGANSINSPQEDGRKIPLELPASGTVPLNQKSDWDAKYVSCYNGGNWSITQKEDRTLSVTVNGWELITQFNESVEEKKLRNIIPYTWLDIASVDSHSYYNPDIVTNYWEVEEYCFSAGELWVVLPYNDIESGDYIAGTYGAGTFDCTLTDASLMMTLDGGDTMAEVSDNANQATTNDDKVTQVLALVNPGDIDQQVRYLKYTNANNLSFNNVLTDGCMKDGKDWILQGSQLTIGGYFAHDRAEAENTGVAYDVLLKFDDTFFEPSGEVLFSQAGSFDTSKKSYAFAAKKDKSGWNHNGKQPNEAGYDEEMIHATTDDLVFFSSLNDLKNAGYVCVGVLTEYRGLVTEQMNHMHTYINGTCKTTAISDQVYMVSHYCRAWNRKALAESANVAKEDLLKMSWNQVFDLVQEHIPYRTKKTIAQQQSMDYSQYPKSFWINGGRDGTSPERSDAIRAYEKASYDSNGYVAGTEGGDYWGDSCLVVGYQTNVNMQVAQKTSQGAIKTAYDMDMGQRVTDYVITPTITRNQGEGSGDGQTKTTTVRVSVTLPNKLTYLDDSSYLGGTYAMTEEGQQGSVTGGTHLKDGGSVDYASGKPLVLTIKKNSDGTTTIVYELRNMVVTQAATQTLPTIRFSCEIGSEGNEANDVVNNESLKTTVQIQSTEDCKRPLSVSNGNEATTSIKVTKLAAVNLSKFADKPVVELNQTMGYTMNVGNGSNNSLQILAVESLPYEGDGASTFTGPCNVTEFSIINLKARIISGLKFYYTTQLSERGKVSEDYTADTFLNTDVWHELTIDGTNGKAILPAEPFRPVAIAAVGTLGGTQTLAMHINIELPEGKGGDIAVNKITNGNLASSARCRIVSRSLGGLTWIDADHDGVRDGNEQLKEGIKVTLLELKSGTYQELKTIDVGQQYDVAAQTTVPHKTGEYLFTNLPAGTYAVRFSPGDFKFAYYHASPVKVGADDTIDSDAIPIINATDKTLEQTEITGIVMPEAETLSYATYTILYQDSGFFAWGTKLPETGGIGTEIYTLSGLLLVIAALMCGYKIKCERERKGKRR